MVRVPSLNAFYHGIIVYQDNFTVSYKEDTFLEFPKVLLLTISALLGAF